MSPTSGKTGNCGKPSPPTESPPIWKLGRGAQQAVPEELGEGVQGGAAGGLGMTVGAEEVETDGERAGVSIHPRGPTGGAGGKVGKTIWVCPLQPSSSSCLSPGTQQVTELPLVSPFSSDLPPQL